MNKKKMICMIVGIAVVVSAMVDSQAVAGNKKNDQKKDWAQFYRYQGKNDSLEVSPNVVFMGNSITDNWAKMRPEFFLKHNIAGRGISGQTSSQMLVRFRRDVLDLKPKAVVILSGTNDIAENNGYISLDNIFGNIVSMCELAKHNGVQPIIASLLPCAYYKWRPTLTPAGDIKVLNAMLEEYAEKEKITFVDYHTALVDERGGLPEKWSADGCHPNVDAYEIMEGIVMNAIASYVE